MFKQNTRRRIVSLALAVMMLITSAVPSFAMGYDDLQTVIDMTGSATSSTEGSGALPDGVEQEPSGSTEGEGDLPDLDPDAPPSAPEEGTSSVPQEPSDPPGSV